MACMYELKVIAEKTREKNCIVCRSLKRISHLNFRLKRIYFRSIFVSLEVLSSFLIFQKNQNTAVLPRECSWSSVTCGGRVQRVGHKGMGRAINTHIDLKLKKHSKGSYQSSPAV